MVRVLRFRLFGIPIRVRPSFLLIAALLGFSTGELSRIVAWVVIVFFSILIHELGHALTARGFGSEVQIELNGIGGLTSWTVPAGDFGPGKRALVAAAGSGVGVVFGALMWLYVSNTGPYTGMAGFVLTNLIWVNLFWGLLNWLPIRPLDGGHLLESLLTKIAPQRAERIANVIFLATAAAALLAAIYFRLIFVALIAGWLLLSELSRGRMAPIPRTAPPPMSFDDPEPDISSIDDAEIVDADWEEIDTEELP